MEKSMDRPEEKMYWLEHMTHVHPFLSRYFTWDGGKFPSSVDMINGVATKGRKVW